MWMDDLWAREEPEGELLPAVRVVRDHPGGESRPDSPSSHVAGGALERVHAVALREVLARPSQLGEVVEVRGAGASGA